ncbi:bifunctional DNA primase/helicase [Salmonella enterica]|uniref:Bifunctional DNA primase/helicase n=3 Tax=Salmonella enterica TaxID=28901 RepID=A0A744HLH4_SALER|nr:toprim domain-containing protein [Salmonella enterica]EBH9882996.1 bifunctional DNA primase/helicase [Salmonella enterica subsp. enterica serovar Kisarawe]EBP4059847.1 bifunctional DNA primase/helicase [Salmonella enterica subsp. enterica]AXD42559.1 bifunctional DNA primase/helicase [Salmonella enterica]EAS5875297.1 bifunctional DNA primase/helicase [Salmonella enterica]EAT8296911.1 bifunctional DNA primase/helicase [Salmonella enterica]
MTPSELSDLLWAQVDRVAPHLLPSGKKEGQEWVAGNVNGDKGNSLKINLSGKKKWADFAEGDGGDMLDLWMACRGINLHQAMQEAKAFLGIKDDDHHFDARREKKFSRPDRKKIARYVTRTESHLEYLQSRGISPEVVKRYEVVSGKVWNGERELDALVLPYKRDGELLQVKRISTERPDGKKVIMAEGDCEPCLFGWQALDTGVRAVVLCEGEIDCMSYAQYGIPALSVPFGGGKGAKQQWIEFEFHNLDRFEEIFISMDVDDVGREAAREIASRLGEHRCRLVTLPHKDINECLMNGVTEDEIWQYIGTASYFDPEELYSAREFYQDTVNAFYGKQQYLFNPPWETLAYNFQFREAELTLVNGVNGHGKTEVVGHMALEAMRQGVKTCVASLELKPGILLKRLTRQSTCCKMPPVLEIESAFKFYDDRLWLFGLTGTAKAERLIEIFTYARRRYGIQLFIIDSLMKCGIGDDDYNGQKAFVDALCDFKNKTNSHIILVTHSRKGDSEEKPTGKMDVKGSGAITDLTDNLFIIWRNKARERALQRVQAGEQINEKDQQLLAAPASVLMLEKQRNGEGWEGGVPLFLDEQSHQFLQMEGASPYNYIANMPKSEYDEVWRQENVTEY